MSFALFHGGKSSAESSQEALTREDRTRYQAEWASARGSGSGSGSPVLSESKRTVSVENPLADIDSPSSADDAPKPDDNGDYIGPKSIIHRYDVGIRFIQILMMLWLLSGFAFITAITLCVWVNVGYVSFRSSGRVFLIVMAFTFISILLWQMYSSLLRTFGHMCMRIWKEKFGAGKRDFFLLRWVDVLAKRAANWVNTDEDDDKFAFWVDLSKTVILLTLMCIFVGAPLIAVASIFGYWAIVNVLCSVLTICSSSLIVLVNLSGRFIRFGRFTYNIYTRFGNTVAAPPRLLCSYLALTGNDHGRNIINVFCMRGLRVALIVFFASVVFSGFTINLWVYVTLQVFVIFVLIVRFRRIFPCYKPIPESTSDGTMDAARDAGRLTRIISDLEMAGYDRGENWKHIWLVFGVRFVTLLVSFIALVYMDLKQVRSPDGRPPIEISFNEVSGVEMVLYAAAFFLITITKDALLFVPMYGKARPFLLGLFQFAQLGFAIGCMIWFKTFTFTSAVLLAVTEMRYRDGRYFWTCRSTDRCSERRRKRATRNTCMIISLMLVFVFVALMVGFGVSSARDKSSGQPSFQDLLRDPPQLGIKEMIDLGGQRTPLCAMSYTRESLSLIDLGVMSDAVYQNNPDDVLNAIHLNPRLKDWRLGWYALDDGTVRGDTQNSTIQVIMGVRFAEFVHPKSNISVVAIRGTHAIEDVFQDMYLWFTPFLLQMSSYAGTLINLWPIDTVAMVVKAITDYASYPSLVYWGEMQQIVEDIINSKSRKWVDVFSRASSSQTASVMVTGHSLGGGLAGIVGAHLNIPAVTFSSPGLGYSIHNYNLTQPSIMTQVVNLVPLNDPVPAFDKQISTVIHITCDAGSPMQCHMVSESILTLMGMCGVPRA